MSSLMDLRLCLNPIKLLPVGNQFILKRCSNKGLTLARTIRTSTRFLSTNECPEVTVLPPYVHPSLSYAYGRSTKPFLIETIPQLLNIRANGPRGDQLFFTSHHEKLSFSYKTMQDEALRLASILHHQLGVNKGDMAGIWSLNIASWAVVKFAVDCLGAVLCTVNPYYKTDELAYLVNKSKLKVLFMPGEKSRQEPYNNFSTIIRDQSFHNQVNQSSLKHIFLLDGEKTSNQIGNYSVHCFEDFSRNQPNLPTDVNPDSDSPHVLMFTSGTTGKPKGALLSQFSIINDCNFSSDRLGTLIEGGNDKICCPLPFFHSFAFVHGLVTSVVKEQSLVINGLRFDPKSVAECIKEHECNILLATPTMALDLMDYLDKKKTRLDSLKTICLGGALSDPEIIVRLRKKMPHLKTVLNGFGSTELSPASTLAHHEDPDDLILTTVGRPLDHVECKVVDPQTLAIVKHDERGEIWIRGFNVMLGYFEDEEKTREAITPAGWYRTGDLGRMNSKGFFKIVGRIKEMIIRGGENVYPQEVENVLMSHPSISEAHVFGIPDPRLGEEICAWIKLTDDSTPLTREEVREFLKGKVTYFKIPRHVHFVTEFPQTSTFKASKLMMRAQTIEMMKQSKN